METVLNKETAEGAPSFGTGQEQKVEMTQPLIGRKETTMSAPTRLFLIICAAAAVLTASTIESHARGRDGLGMRAGMSMGPDQFLIGGQAELGPVLDASYLVPSLDFGFDDQTTVVANLDLRWYLLRLPETAIHFYGSAGPTMVLSPGTEVGLTLTAGVHIPMKHQRRYNMELRFGFGDVPDVKIVAALMFGM
jgi:hypothetical protein